MQAQPDLERRVGGVVGEETDLLEPLRVVVPGQPAERAGLHVGAQHPVARGVEGGEDAGVLILPPLGQPVQVALAGEVVDGEGGSARRVEAGERRPAGHAQDAGGERLVDGGQVGAAGETAELGELDGVGDVHVEAPAPLEDSAGHRAGGGRLGEPEAARFERPGGAGDAPAQPRRRHRDRLGAVAPLQQALVVVESGGRGGGAHDRRERQQEQEERGGGTAHDGDDSTPPALSSQSERANEP